MSGDMKATAPVPEASRSASTGSVLDRLVLPARRVGPATVGVLAVALAVLWLIVGPSDGSWGSFFGQLAGAEAVLLMSIALVLISTLPWVETWFDGIDRTAGLDAAVTVQDLGKANDAELRAGVDAAYRAKYGRYGSTTVDRMVNDDAAATTLQLNQE